jgi:polyisoprenoid-binding protein YceI
MRAPRSSRAFAMVLCSSIAIAVPNKNVDVDKSSFVAIFTQEHVPVEASFQRFGGEIAYDPTNLGAATVSLDVETGSLDLGDPSYGAEIRKPSWFDSTSFPNATFRSKGITAISASRLECLGVLTIKGKPLTVKIPVSVTKVATGVTFDGTLDVSRKAFGIGSADWDDVLEDKVIIKFHILNNR